MSFITKRERVFNEYCDPFDIPARNEGKLKAYSSCTDARAWSHFLSDKTEHLVEIIKRNNEVCTGKYVPLNVIIDMMMSSKNTEIERLKRKISTLEKMLTSYDQLELSCEQKCEISLAHSMIRAAAESLEELPLLDLDVSGFTEGPDSEGFETGKSGGDNGIYTAHSASRVKSVEWAPGSLREGSKEMKEKESKHSGTSLKSKSAISLKAATLSSRPMTASGVSTTDLAARCHCDASTSIHDTRIDEMQESLISKDAKLNALQNTIAVMENDVCEPYCIYAHIYTALEKIYATLSQNDKYRLFLNLMSSGKDTRCLDIKGKILFKLKILEKFSVALLAPCSERFKHDEPCECYYTEVSAVVEDSLNLTLPEPQVPESNRSRLIADIMENEEMKDILQRDSNISQPKLDVDDIIIPDNYSIESENLNRLKNLQINYDDLMNHYENVKRERDNLKIRCQKYNEMEEELEKLKALMREYNGLYNERDFYRKRSEDLDSLKEQYLVLADETSTLETRIKAEAEINSIKSNAIDELRSENIDLEKRLNDATIAFEKEKNAVLCKLKEAECKIMCQEQQIRSLSAQVDSILGQDGTGLKQGRTSLEQESPHVSNLGHAGHYHREDFLDTAYVMDEIESLKNQIKTLNDALYSTEDEKQQLQDKFEGQLKLINELRMEIEDWKSTYEKTLQKNNFLEKYTDSVRDEIQRLVEENKMLSQDDSEKTAAVSNLINVINNKSQEINRLTEEIAARKEDSHNLLKQLQELKNKYDYDSKKFENQKQNLSESLQLAKRESKELIEKMKNFDDIVNAKEEFSKALAKKSESYTELRNKLTNAIEENQKLQLELSSQEENNSILLQEIKRLRDINSNVSFLQDENEQFKQSFELQKKESKNLEEKLKHFEDLHKQLQTLKLSHEMLIRDKAMLENELKVKNENLDEAMHSVELTKKESESLLEKLNRSENLKEDMIKLSNDYKYIMSEKEILQKVLEDKSNELDKLAQTLANLQLENEQLLRDCQKANDLEKELARLKQQYDELIDEKTALQRDFDNKTHEINGLCNTLDSKIEENRDLLHKIQELESSQSKASNDLSKLQDINAETQSMLHAVRKESDELINKLKTYEMLKKEHEDLKRINDKLKQEKQVLSDNLEKQLKIVNKLEEEKEDLEKISNNIISQYNQLEFELAGARQEIINMNLNSPYANILKEIEDMKMEKVANHNKIRELLEKLDEADSIISNLSEDVIARTDKIAILENHINSLEDEVRQLHKNLAEVVNTGEELKDNTKKIDHTLNKLEAHHSKATHNMKTELAKLQNQNSELEEQLSMTKIKSDESVKDKHKYISQIIHLQNEKEIIVTDIKQLELSCAGDSVLSPESCNAEEVLKSLDKIRKCIDARHSKANSLEQTLIKVQTSSQLLISKADEAKRLVEKEKQKIINEKEDAIAMKMKKEAELLDLKLQLEVQTARDNDIIKDLQKEILNQNLIFDKLNQSTKDYISKLEDDLRALQDLYQTSLDKVSDLQGKVQNLTDDNNEKRALIHKINKDFERKSEEVAELQKTLNEIKAEPKKYANALVGTSNKIKHTNTQTDEDFDFALEENLKMENVEETKILSEINNMKNVNRPTSPTLKPLRPSDANQTQNRNEVQILSAKVESPAAFTHNKYVEFKKMRLSPGKLELHEISPMNVVEKTPINELYESKTSPERSFLDFYSKRSEFQTISENVYTSDSNNEASYSGIKYSTNKFDSVQSRPSQEDINKANDLFLIYHDSESSHGEEKPYKDQKTAGKHPEIFVETLTLPKQRYPFNIGTRKQKTTENERNPNILFDNNIKPTLNITLPRVDSLSADTIPDNSKLDIPSTIQNQYITRLKLKDKVPYQTKDLFIKQSPHRLSPVEADVGLIKGKSGPKANKKKSQEDFGLDYILNSFDEELGPQPLRRSRSDSFHSQIKSAEEVDLYEESNVSHLVSTPVKSKEKDQPKILKEQSVMVNVDPLDYYENKIQRLSQQLNNTEKDCKKKLEAIKIQYNNHIKSIINEHNQGVNSIQSLHEETLQDIIKVHENEVENLRSMSIEAMRKAERLEKENLEMMAKMQDCGCDLEEEPIRMSTFDIKKRYSRCRSDMRMLTKTNVEAFNVKPKVKPPGPCTCSLDVNLSDTIRNIFEQVDVEQRKLAENAYLRFIANKILSSSFEALDTHELSFLHLKVCRTWKSKITKEEALQKKIDTLEIQMLTNKRSKQKHLADLDRDLAEAHRRLTEAREAVCKCSLDRSSPLESRGSNTVDAELGETMTSSIMVPHTSPYVKHCEKREACFEINERRSAGDILPDISEPSFQPRSKLESRAVLAKLDVEERRVKKLYDEAPTRLRRSHDRATRPPRK